MDAGRIIESAPCLIEAESAPVIEDDGFLSGILSSIPRAADLVIGLLIILLFLVFVIFQFGDHKSLTAYEKEILFYQRYGGNIPTNRLPGPSRPSLTAVASPSSDSQP